MRNPLIILNIDKKSTFNKELRFKQFDTGHQLNLKVISDGKYLPLSDYTVLAFFQLPNNKPLEQRNCIINSDIITINLDNYLLSEYGVVNFEIEFHKDGEITTTFRNQFIVEESFDTDDAVTTEPHWDLINQFIGLTPDDYVSRTEYESAMANIQDGIPVDLEQYSKKTDISTVATTGQYSDLKGKPTKLSQFQNDLELSSGGSGGTTVVSGSGYGVIVEGNDIISATQPNDALEIEGVGIDVELIKREILSGRDKLRLSKSDTFFTEILGKPFESLSSDFIVDDNGVVTIDRNKIGGASGGGGHIVDIKDFKIWEPNPDYVAGVDDPSTAYIEISYGALGDNYTSGQIDTIAFDKAFKIARDFGSVNINIPDGHYILNQTIQLYPNTSVTMSRNAVLRKNHDHPTFSNSQPNEWFLGYSGRGKIYWVGGTLDCKDATNIAREGSTFSLVNAEYFEFKSIIFLDQRNTHHFDLSGVRNIVVSECYFYGYTYDTKNPDGTDIAADQIRAYSECIQLDYSSHQAMPSQNTGHDGTACQFIFVQHCKFDKSDTYPSWNRCVGMHNVYFPTYNWLCNTDGTLTGNNFNFEYSKAKNVYVTDNEIYGNGTIIHDYYTIDSVTGEKIYDSQDFIIQMIRLLNVDNVYISGNKFENCKGGVSFDCDQSSKTMTDTDAQRDFNTKNSGHLMPYSVEWTDNRGDKKILLYSESTSDKGTKVTTYTQYGKTYTITWAKTAKVLDYYGISNCHVLFNTFKNITAGIYDANGVPAYQPSTPIYVRGECRTKASATKQGTRANKVIVIGNIIDGIETVPCENQSRIASAQGLTVSAAGTTGASWTPNIVSAISASYTRNATIIGNEIRNCSRAVYLSGCNRGLIANNQIFTINDTEAVCVVGGGIYLISNNIMDNLYDSAIRMKGTDQFFVEGNIITNANKGTTWQIDVPFFQYNPKDKAVIWVEVDGSGGSNYGSVSNNKIYTSFTSDYIKYPVYIGSENTYVKSAGNFYFGTYQFKNNADLNFSDCGLDTAFRGNDAETLNGYSVDKLKDIFVQDTDKGAVNGVASLDSTGKIPIAQMPTSVTQNSGGFKTIILPIPPDSPDGTVNETINATTYAPMLNLQGEGGISFDAMDGNILKIRYDYADQVNHIASNDQAIQNITDWQDQKANPHMALDTAGVMGGKDIHVIKVEKDKWNQHIDLATVGVTGGADIHVTNQQKTDWNNHLANTDVHVTITDKTNWNGKANTTDVDTDFFKKTDASTKQVILPYVQFDKDVTLTKYEEKYIIANDGICDLSKGSIFKITPTATITINLTNPSFTSGDTTYGFAQSIVLYIVMGTTLQTINFPSTVKWHNATPITMTTNKVYEIVLRTIDNGVSWLASNGGAF